ncbi:hypothetical protein [Chryseobacterium indoltheticum]|uniref:hypothetical protein n=1 Tax=Chryseobacterium indoltheticum TaxID=254 RepID=UPI00242E8A9C|nr:hypothetical protein [Chryseobacterium indoltheticum]MDF2833777.1 hypothetical protein [Chryseobacterium indoltheticum]
MINQNNKIVYVIFLSLLLGCKSQSRLTYWKMHNQTQKDLLAEKEYQKIAPKNLKITNNSVLIKFNIYAFKDKFLILDESDTISFENLSVDCGEINRRIPKSNRKITLRIDENIIIIPIKNNYNFIKVQGLNNDKWNIIYSQFFPKFECM